jgi:two-component system CheB/CheR fusion protein
MRLLWHTYARGLLIYLQREVQDKLFDIFHYALNPGGYVFLGNSESLEHLPDLFGVVNKTHRIYQAKPWQREWSDIPSVPLTLRQRPGFRESTITRRPHQTRSAEAIPTFEEQHEKALESHGPPSVIVDQSHTILHVSETAGRFLVHPKGPLTGDVLKLVRPEIQLELRSALFQAFEKDRSIVSAPVFVQFNGHARKVVVAVRPLIEVKGPGRPVEKHALVLFLENELDETIEATEAKSTQVGEHPELNQLVAQLQSENQHLREQLQVTTEEYESSNEEMKVANEELQSTNEEYRSATEELETSQGGAAIGQRGTSDREQ